MITEFLSLIALGVIVVYLFRYGLKYEKMLDKVLKPLKDAGAIPL